jgi:hypothetical protein
MDAATPCLLVKCHPHPPVPSGAPCTPALVTAGSARHDPLSLPLSQDLLPLPGTDVSVFSTLGSLMDVLCTHVCSSTHAAPTVPLLRCVVEVVVCHVTALGRLEQQLLACGAPRDDSLARASAALMACHLQLPALCARLPRLAQVVAEELPVHLVRVVRLFMCGRASLNVAGPPLWMDGLHDGTH